MLEVSCIRCHAVRDALLKEYLKHLIKLGFEPFVYQTLREIEAVRIKYSFIYLRTFH